MESGMNDIKKRRLHVLKLLLISDIFLFLILQLFGYHVVPYFKSPGLYIILITEILIIMICLHLRKKLMSMLLIPLFVVILAACALWSSIMDYHYSFIKSPGQTQTLIVKYRVTTLGESSYSFDFYQRTFFGLFMKKLEGQDYFTMIKASSGDYTPGEVLGIGNARWINEQEIIFSTITGEKKVTLK